jgi:hypothetical protein
MPRPLRVLMSAALSVGALMVAPAISHGSYHLMKISEVHQGLGDTGDFVELQMYSAGQNLVGGRYVRTYDGGGNAFSTFPIPSNVANGESQRTILIANDATVPGADFNAAGNLKVVNANGGVCFLESFLDSSALDCVAWGSQMGTQPWGTPLALTVGTIPDNSSIHRRIDRGCATLLEAGDDTNDSSADFAIATPSPRPNSVTPTETACAPKIDPPTKKKKCKKGFKLKKIKPKKKGKKPKKKCVRVKKKK